MSTKWMKRILKHQNHMLSIKDRNDLQPYDFSVELLNNSSNICEVSKMQQTKLA